MSHPYAWTPTTGPLPDPRTPDGALPHDIAAVAALWVDTAYDDLRRAGPDRAAQIRWIVGRYVVPWFAPQTDTVADITYFMVHGWLLRLVGRNMADDAHPHGDAVRRPAGLAQTVVADVLWTLRGILGFARATGIVPPGFDPTEGLVPPAPDPASARTPRPTAAPRPLTWSECARVAAHLHPVHQLALWLQRVMGLRISEAFGLRVNDVVDHGDGGFLLVRGQGGRAFTVRDEHGRVVTVAHKERTKTAAATRALPLPAPMLDLLRVAIDAFHTDPDTGDPDPVARLVPGIRTPDEGGQLGFRNALDKALAAEGLSTADLGFRVCPHLLRKSVATDIAWQPGIEDPVRRRFMGHRAGDDVYGRVYTLDHPDLTPLTAVARALEEMIAGSIGTLMIPTTRRIHWARTHPTHARAADVAAVLDAAGWTVDPDSFDDPLCDTRRVASELQIADSTARRWMRDGALRCVTTTDGDGIAWRWARLSDVWALRDRLAHRILLPDLALDLGVRYHELYQCARRLGLDLAQHPTSRQYEITHDDAQQLRDEYARVRALHARAVKVAAAARDLNLAASTVRLMAERGDLEIDPETDSSRARFVTRASVERARTARARTTARPWPVRESVPLADVIRFTGRTRAELLDLVYAGVLVQAPGRRACQLTAASLQAWLTGTV